MERQPRRRARTDTDSPRSFRGARKASEPGIQMHAPKLFLDSGFAPSAPPGMTARLRFSVHLRGVVHPAGAAARAVHRDQDSLLALLVEIGLVEHGAHLLLE